MKTRVLAMMAAVVLLSSCNEPQSVEPSPEVYSFSSAINPATRATEYYFEDGDAIAVSAFADEACGELVQEGAKYICNNMVFRGADSILYDDTKSLVFRAVYPYTENMNEPYRVELELDQTTAKAYSQSDIMYAQTAPTYNSRPELSFYHCMSRLLINLSAVDCVIEDYQVAIHAKTRAYCCHFEGGYGASGDVNTVYPMKVGYNYFQAVVPPQPIAIDSNGFVEVIIDGETYTMKLDREVMLYPGWQYEVNCTVGTTRSGKPSVEWSFEQI